MLCRVSIFRVRAAFEGDKERFEVVALSISRRVLHVTRLLIQTFLVQHEHGIPY